jgi:diguanylate cyclase (GGDEF)-like protein
VEFVVVLPETPFADLQRLGDKLCAAVAALELPHSGSTTAKHVTISVGGATRVPQPSDSPQALTASADKALYQSKHSGRNRATTIEESAASASAA